MFCDLVRNITGTGGMPLDTSRAWQEILYRPLI